MTIRLDLRLRVISNMQILTVPVLLNLTVPQPCPFGDWAVLHASQDFLASAGIGTDGDLPGRGVRVTPLRKRIDE